MNVPQIKIHDLSLKIQQDVNDSDIMVIEDGNDTKKITIADLKLLFSADNKISSLQQSIDKQLTAMVNEINGISRSVQSSLSSYEGSVADLSSQIEDAKRQIGILQQSILNYADTSNTTNSTLDTLVKTVDDLKITVSNNSKSISDLTTSTNQTESTISQLSMLVSNNTKSISVISQALEGLSKVVVDNYNELSNKITDLDNKLTAYIDKKYDNAIKYIDYYHHIHENPPNFDESFNGEDPISMNYMLPIGTIYETANPDFDPDKHFPGIWEFCGVGTASTEDNDQVEFYTFVRVE